MFRASLALVVALISLPACTAPQSPGLIRGGDCRPDIGPGGLLKIAFEQEFTQVAVSKTPIGGGDTIFMAKNQRARPVEIKDWVRYAIRFRFFRSGTVRASLWRGTMEILALETPQSAGTPTPGQEIVLQDADPGDPLFNSPGTLKVHAQDPRNQEWYVTTVYVTQRIP